MSFMCHLGFYQVKSWSWQKVCMAPGSNADKIGKIIVFVMLNLL